MTTGPRYELTLFISGATALSARAVADTRRMCDIHLGGRCDLSVIDLRQDAAAGDRSQIVAVPALVRNGPPPTRKIVGDLSDSAKVLRALELSVAR